MIAENAILNISKIIPSHFPSPSPHSLSPILTLFFSNFSVFHSSYPSKILLHFETKRESMNQATTFNKKGGNAIRINHKLIQIILPHITMGFTLETVMFPVIYIISPPFTPPSPQKFQ